MLARLLAFLCVVAVADSSAPEGPVLDVRRTPSEAVLLCPSSMHAGPDWIGEDDEDDGDCDDCKGTLKFHVVVIPGSGWPFNPANVITAAVWGAAVDAISGVCYDVEGHCTQVGVGCSDSVTPQFGYNSPGHETYVLPPTTPPTPPASGAAVATATSPLSWLDTNCGEWGSGGYSAFSIFKLKPPGGGSGRQYRTYNDNHPLEDVLQIYTYWSWCQGCRAVSHDRIGRATALQHYDLPRGDLLRGIR
jgi:hypothetical protein